MKCPKCGYNSFEYNDTCVKCSNDLKAFKATYNIEPVVLPGHALAAIAADFSKTALAAVSQTETSSSASDMFSFDLSPQTQDAPGDNPFNFGEEPDTAKASPFDDFNFAGVSDTPKAASAESNFSELLDQSPAPGAAHQTPVQPSDNSANKDEFDLSDFSWDDTPSPVKTEEPKPPSDDFGSLFGDAAKK